MLGRLVPSLTGRPFTSLAASRSPTASGRATMCSTTRTRAKNTTPSFGRWLTNGFASCISAGKSAPRTTRIYTWKYSKNGARFSPPCTRKRNDKNYGREGSGDYPEATLRLPHSLPKASPKSEISGAGARGALAFHRRERSTQRGRQVVKKLLLRVASSGYCPCPHRVPTLAGGLLRGKFSILRKVSVPDCLEYRLVVLTGLSPIPLHPEEEN